MMSPEERKQYLDNLVLMARADGVVHPAEQQALEHLFGEIKAKKREIAAAETRVESGAARPAVCGRLSLRIQMVEDMALVASADGSVPVAEENLLRELARAVGLSEAYLGQLFREAAERRAAIFGSALVPCTSCGTASPSGARFCSGCGAPVGAGAAESAPVATDIKVPDRGITVEFAESSSPSLAAALQVARQSDSFQEAVRSRKRWYAATWREQEMESILALVGHLKGWRSRNVYVRGEPQEWDSVFGFAWCAQRRSTAYRPDAYCFLGDGQLLNIWGCLQSQMEWARHARWFSYGRFEGEKNFRFDKQRILHELQTNLYRYRFCPHMNQSYLVALMELFPERVGIDGRTWAYRETYEDSPGALTLKRREDAGDGYTFETTMRVDGASPVDFRLAASLVSESLAKANLPKLSLPTLKIE